MGNQPVEILVEDVYLLVIPSPQTSTNPEEDEARAQTTKAERLENAELLHVRGQTDGQSGERCLSVLSSQPFNSLDSIQAESTQTQGLVQSLIAKIINNVQVTIRNIHVRYEDRLSVPGVSPRP